MIAVCGVDLAAGRGITEVVTLRAPERPTPGGLPRYDPTCSRRAENDAEIVGVLAAARPTVVAVDAPLTLPAVVVAALAGEPPEDGSPYVRAAERDPIWRELGVRPLPVSFPGGLTLRALVLQARLAAVLPEMAIIEAFPTAALRALGIHGWQAEAPRQKKTTPAARVATQIGLRRWVIGVPAPDSEPWGADQLDALAAALTALAYQYGVAHAAGEAREGQIWLPDGLRLARTLGLSPEGVQSTAE